MNSRFLVPHNVPINIPSSTLVSDLSSQAQVHEIQMTLQKSSSKQYVEELTKTCKIKLHETLIVRRKIVILNFGSHGDKQERGSK